MSIRSFDDFIRVPIKFYKTIGDEPYKVGKMNPCRSIVLRVILILGFLNFNLLVGGEIIYFVLAMSSFSTVLEATAVAPCIGFSLVADIKEAALYLNKNSLTNLLDELRELFPKTIEDQNIYKVHSYEKPMRRVMVIFSFLCLAYTSTFSIYPIIRSTIGYYFLGWNQFERNFGFFIWYPYNATENKFIYGLTYMGQVHGAYLAGVAFLAYDLILCSVVTMLCMHFDYISKQFEQFQVRNDSNDIEFLKKIIPYHIRILTLSENINEIFSISILLNFMTSSSTICFIGFQVTASSTEDIVKYCIFLVASMVQVMIICYYGNSLIDSSTNVANAAFYHNWTDGSTIYKKYILQIIHRSHKPAMIRPPTFPPISYVTFMKVISMSYQFFALLRTSYAAQ